MSMPKSKPKKSAPKKNASSKPIGQAAPAKRTVAKVSPLRGMSVEDWIAAKTTAWQSDVIRKMVAVVRRAAPGATHAIKWSQPIFEQNGPFAFIKPAKAHVSFGFWRGAEVADPKGILERGDRMGHFKVKSELELDERALATMVKHAVRLNHEKGSPTTRR